jgi:Protein of unknown function (DUF3618)
MNADKNAAVDELRDDITRTREDLGGTVSELAERTDTTTRRSLRWGGGIVAGLAAAAAAIGVLRWRQSRNKPKNRAERMWRDVKSRATDARKDAKSKARDAKRVAGKMKSKLSR